MTMKKFNVLMLVLAMILVLLAGCSGNNAPANSEASDAGKKESADDASTTNATATNGDSAPVERTERDIFFFHQLVQLTGDLPIFKKAAEVTGVVLNNVAPAGGDEKQAWNLLLASGELPDIINYYINDLNAIGIQKALIPLDDLIAEHAPHFKKFLDEHPDIVNAITASDGQIYVVPWVADGEAQEGWFIRQDWLDKLKLEVPTTVDEYYKVLKAFREQDPNGNGLKDEVPYFHRNTGNGHARLFPFWDAYHDFYVRDGKIVYGPNEPEYRTALTELAKWYKEGLIDQEIFTRGTNSRDVLFSNNTGGSLHDWFASTSKYNPSMEEKVPGFNLQPIAPPASVSGRVYEVSKRRPITNLSQNRGWSISASAKDPEKVMQYFDYWWSEEGRRLLNFGIEGETYTMVDGKPRFKDEVLSEPALTDYLIKTTGAQLQIGGWQDFSYEEQFTNEIALQGIRMYIDNQYISNDYQLPPVTLTMEEDKRINELFPQIKTYVDETAQKWYMGGESVEANYDKYLERLGQLQIDEVLEIYNAAYQRYLN